MKKFKWFEPELGSWTEGRRRYDGVVDLIPQGHILADDSEQAIALLKIRNPIVEEVTN